MLPHVHIGNLEIPTYGICMVIGIMAAAIIAIIRAKRTGRDENSLIVIAACAVGLGLAGAKILYIIASYGLQKALQEMSQGNFSCFTEGGLVFYGGLIGGIGGAYIGAAIAKEKLTSYIDTVVPCVPLGHAFGRLGCFLGGCCYGMPYEGFGSVTFPAVGVNHGVFPVQLVEMVINIGIFVYLIHFTKKERGKYAVLFVYMGLYGVSRFLLEMLRGDSIRGIANGLSTSQWISIALIIVSLIPVITRLMKKKGGSAPA